MNLIELFDTLTLPNQASENFFNAIPIPDYSSFRVAMDSEGNAVLLLAVKDSQESKGLKNFRLKYLQLVKDVHCKITENHKTTFEVFTVITFISADRHLQEYFLRISETLVKSLSSLPTQREVVDTLNKFVEIFRALNDSPTNTIQGLWTEMLLIDICHTPKTLLKYWHDLPEEIFDFSSGIEKIEVKSTSTSERIHTFSSEQLNPPQGTKLLIASLFVKQSSSGHDIQSLIDSITAKIDADSDLTNKLNTLVSRTLGSTLEQSIKIKFDYDLARDSLQFYHYEDIKKIEKINIPAEVSGVKYKSDLSIINSIDITKVKPKGILFSCF
jgi:hypothetical protein